MDIFMLMEFSSNVAGCHSGALDTSAFTRVFDALWSVPGIQKRKQSQFYRIPGSPLRGAPE
jgi:hypothetical protein